MGFDDLSKQLKKLSKEIEKQSETEASLEEILNNEFISRKTSYSSYLEFMEALPYDISQVENLQELDDQGLNDHIKSNTTFNTWNELINTATEEFMSEKLKNIFK
jgi:hypothetical protein